ncbi:MAG: SsrA-binding protein SmpB [Phycisphaerae bacterium]|nr:SsrA-binding protein SmpB [Phycisphaerae bacterium]
MAKSGKNKAKGDDRGPVIENRRARYDYHITDTLETGVKLIGPEVKSVRDGKVSLAEGYVRVEDEPPELWMYSVNIAEYGPSGTMNDAPTRTRKLLAHRREIAKLARAVQVKGMTLIPLRMYFKGSFAKVLIGLAQGKTKGDKRRAIAERDVKREIARAISRRA